jgi:hypothetical protein
LASPPALECKRILGVVARIALHSVCSTDANRSSHASRVVRGLAITDSNGLETVTWGSIAEDGRSAVTSAEPIFGSHGVGSEQTQPFVDPAQLAAQY